MSLIDKRGLSLSSLSLYIRGQIYHKGHDEMELLTKEVTVKWRTENKKYYEGKGYKFTGDRSKLVISVHDLKSNSNILVKVRCVKCRKEFEIGYSKYLKLMSNPDINRCDCTKVIKKNAYDKNLYYEYCQKIIDISKLIGKTPTIYDLKKYDNSVPNYRWFIEYAPTKDIVSYNTLMSHIGLKPNYFVTKEMATEIVLKMFERNDGVLMKESFSHPSHDEIGIGTVKRIWGSLNNMFNDLNLPINKGSMIALSKPLEQLEDDIKRLCEYLYKKNGHKHVSLDNITECEWCSSHGTYNAKFNEAFGLTISEYISHIGYIPNNAGMGMNYKFDDGELTTSKYEYIFSKFLRDNGIRYTRNIRYDSFISDYFGNKDCDYIIEINSKKYYIEIAGMLRDCTSIEHGKKMKMHSIQTRYLKDLIDKERMLKEAKLNYYILFPRQINDEDFLIGLKNNFLLAS